MRENALLFGTYFIGPWQVYAIVQIWYLLAGAVAGAVLWRSRSLASAARALLVGFIFGLLNGGSGAAWAGAEFPIISATAYLCWAIPGSVQVWSMAMGVLRPKWFRALITIPAHMLLASSLFAPLSLLCAWLGGARDRDYTIAFGVNLGVVCLSLVSTLLNIKADVTIVLDGASYVRYRQLPAQTGLAAFVQPKPPGTCEVTIAQITDPHLGPFMSVSQLRTILADAVARNPDIIAMTGDFWTVESHYERDALMLVCEPLRQYRGTVVAIHGNHDQEGRRLFDETIRQFRSAGVQMLVDEDVLITTKRGVRVHVIGSQFSYRGKAEHVRSVASRHARVPGALRLCLNHDPMEFRAMPDGVCDLMLTGHLHGGHLGLWTPWFVLSLFSLFTAIGWPWPASGFWARGRNRLVVHRGQGFYGFPLRVGIPGEEGLLRVIWHSTAYADLWQEAVAAANVCAGSSSESTCATISFDSAREHTD